MIPRSPSTVTLQSQPKSDVWLGLVYLGFNLLISVGAQFLLKAAMLELGAFDGGRGWLAYLLSMINPQVIGGLVMYGLGTILWILCLGKLDLSLAYPAGTLQYLLIFAGAWFWFDEQISVLRLLGMLVICLGVLIMSIDVRKR